MLKAINHRFQNYFLVNDTNKELLLASASLPRTKCNFISNDDDMVYVKRILIDECKFIRNENGDVANNDTNQSVSLLDDDFLISFAQQRSQRRSSIESEIESEVCRFFADDRKDNIILNEYPNIKEVYFKYNTTLSSSAPVERIFRQSEMMYTPRRNRINANHFEQALLLKHNKESLNENQIHL